MTGPPGGPAAAAEAVSYRPPPWSTRAKVMVVFAISAAVLLGVVAVRSMDTGGSASAFGAPVEDVSPAPRSSVVRQVPIEVDLESGWTGEMRLNGVPIPEGELSRDVGLGTVTFVPGPGKVIEQLRAGRNCVTFDMWSLERGRSATERRISWCFDAL